MPAQPRLASAIGLLHQGDYARARTAFQQQLSRTPSDPEVLLGLGLAHAGIARAGGVEAKGAAVSASHFGEQLLGLRGRPGANGPELAAWAGRIFFESGSVDAGVAAFERALARSPGDGSALEELLALCFRAERVEAGLALIARHAALADGLAFAAQLHGALLRTHGRVQEAADVFARAVAKWPGRDELALQLPITALYDERVSNEELAALHKAYAGVLGARVKELGFSRHAHGRARPAGDGLRIGLMSPDFREHSVGFFMRGVVPGLRALGHEVFCYATAQAFDATTEHFAGCASGFRVIAGMPMDGAAGVIRADELDVLVDLAGWSEGTMLEVVTLRPARVQLTFLGYSCTTGLTPELGLDGRIADEATEPEGVARVSSEPVLRMGRTYFCYSPPQDAPEAKRAESAAAAGAVTFVCCNLLTKVNDGVLEAWSRVLARVAGSRLVVKAAMLRHEAVRARVAATLARLGVAAERVQLLARVPSKSAHMALYTGADVALDTFPYAGATTTCEAMWMGLPVVTIAGDRHAGRMGVSILGAVGERMPEVKGLIARDVDEYVETAVALAGDVERRREFHARLRGAMRESALCDAAGFCRDFAGVLREAVAGSRGSL